MLTVLSLFSGIGGVDLGLESTGGFRTVAFCEIDPFCREVLRAHWPEVPIHDDVRKLSAQSVGRVDAIVGGFPCQPHSVAGKRKGRDDERHLWPEFARLVRELRPRWVLAENVPGIRTTAADEVLADLEAAGYFCWPLVVGADDVGAPHRRKRVWFVARLDDSDGRRRHDDQPAPAESRGDWTHDGVPRAAGALAHAAWAGQRREPAPERADWLRTGPTGDTALAHRDTSGRCAVRRSVLLDGEREAQRDDADGCGEWPVGEPAGQGLALGSHDGAGTRTPDEASAWPDAARADRSWPARPGEPQHEWEEPRLAYAQPVRRDGRGPDGHGDEHDGPAAGRIESERYAARRDGEDAGPGRPEQPLGCAVHGLPERLARRHNRESLKALGNSVVPQVVAAIGRAILAVEVRA